METFYPATATATATAMAPATAAAPAAAAAPATATATAPATATATATATAMAMAMATAAATATATAAAMAMAPEPAETANGFSKSDTERKEGQLMETPQHYFLNGWMDALRYTKDKVIDCKSKTLDESHQKLFDEIVTYIQCLEKSADQYQSNPQQSET